MFLNCVNNSIIGTDEMREKTGTGGAKTRTSKTSRQHEDVASWISLALEGQSKSKGCKSKSGSKSRSKSKSKPKRKMNDSHAKGSESEGNSSSQDAAASQTQALKGKTLTQTQRSTYPSRKETRPRENQHRTKESAK